MAKDKKIQDVGIINLTSEDVQKYGSAIKEHLVAYSGKDNELGKELVKSLKDVSKSRINKNYEFQNIQQQAGFSAEIKEVANRNAENILKGSDKRKIRTDDLGSVNDPIFDHVELDSKGNIISESGAQMKFVGASEKDPYGVGAPGRALQKLQSKKYEKYIDADAKIEVPSDYYDEIIGAANNQIDGLRKQFNNRLKNRDVETAESITKKMEKLEKIKNNLEKSSVSSKEAVFARLHPGLSTAKSIAQYSNKAGLKGCQNAVIYGGGISVIKNTVQLVKGDIETSEALFNVAKDTGSLAIRGYEVGFAGAAVKGFMQNSSKEYIRSLSKTNLPATLVVIALDAGKTIKRFYKNEIDGVECLEELGLQGTEMLGASLFSVVGQLAIPIPVVGGLIGGMLGYALSSASYSILVNSLKEAKIAHEERLIIEAACEEHIAYIKECRKEIEKVISEYLINSIDIFDDAFNGMNSALQIENVDGFITSTNSLRRALGKEIAYRSFDEFNKIMISDESFKI